MLMDNEMKSYLEQVAIELRVENFKEFGKSKTETADALMQKFSLSKEAAVAAVEELWEKA